MIKDPSYYRDILNRILTEDDEDDIPYPPSREELTKNKWRRVFLSKKYNKAFWHDFLYTGNQGIDRWRIPLSPFHSRFEIIFTVKNKELEVDHEMSVRLMLPSDSAYKDDILAGDLDALWTWRRASEQLIKSKLPREVAKLYGIKATFYVKEWITEDEVSVTSEEFTTFIENELSGIEQFLTEKNIDDILDVVEAALKGWKDDK
jgi:hypothetical protein